MKKIYAQNDLQVVIQNFLEPGGSVTLVLNEIRFVPFVKREIYHMLGTPSWDEHTVLRYSEPKYLIRIVSKGTDEWEQKLRGIPEDEVFYVDGWNVDDVRHSPYCACEEPDEAQGYYVSAEGKLVEDNICDVCGRRISDKPVNEYKPWTVSAVHQHKHLSKQEIQELKHEYQARWVTEGDKPVIESVSVCRVPQDDTSIEPSDLVKWKDIRREE